MWEKIKFMASGMWDFLRPLIRVFLSAIGPVLAQAASTAVQVAATKAITSAEKKDNAYSAIVVELEKQGFRYGADFSASMVNAAIEAAVQGLK
jgi:hypothetical protein